MKFNLKSVLLKLINSNMKSYDTRDGRYRLYVGETHVGKDSKYYFLIKSHTSRREPELAITYNTQTGLYDWEHWVVASGTTAKIARYLSEFQNNTKEDVVREELDSIAKELGLI